MKKENRYKNVLWLNILKQNKKNTKTLMTKNYDYLHTLIAPVHYILTS